MSCLELKSGDRVLTPSAPKLRSLFALLALRGNYVVTTGMLMEELWGGNPPVSALATLQTYIYQLRRVLAEASPCRPILKTRPLGYMISIDHDELDWNQFQDHVRDGQAALGRGDSAAASAVLGKALALSPSAALSDVEAGPMLSAHITELTEARLRALELRVEADLQVGRYRELVGELKTLIRMHPFHEGFYSRLMLSLDRSGRRSEALEVYQQLRTTLVDELGLEPSTEVRKLHIELLTADDGSFTARGAGNLLAAAPTARFIRPAQLPADPPDFVGRVGIVSTLCDLALGTDQTPRARLLNVTGVIGAGKSAVTLHAAHRIRERFADGQFYAEMGVGAGRPGDPYSVLGRFLRATGLASSELPGDLDERAQLFRSWTADRSVLVVLDGVGSAADVQPLLPGGGRCTVMVASQRRLPSLDGAKVIEVGPLEPDSCLELLSMLIGRERVEREEEMAQSIAALCGRLPLAIRVIGAKLAATPHYPLRKIVLRLSDERRLVNELSIGEFDVSARIRQWHLRLTPAARSLLTDLVHECSGAPFSVGVAAAVANLDAFGTEQILEELTTACFLCAVDLDGYANVGFSIPLIIRSFILQEDLQESVALSPVRSWRSSPPIAGLRLAPMTARLLTPCPFRPGGR